MSDSSTTGNPNRISADPAKTFFVSMLVKDITLRDAIGDLVDNAVDAVKESAVNPEDLSGREVLVELKESFFSISDNGAGMESNVARTTAFNFGKPKEHKFIDYSIGQFGIGMKRAFFKIGGAIEIQSVAKTSKFIVDIDVPEWLKEPDKWEFVFKEGTLEENILTDEGDRGLKCRITNLNVDTSTSFKDKTFVDTLIKEITLEHMLNINKGLVIKINGHQLATTTIDIVNDDLIKPTYWEEITPGQSVKVVAGISSKDAEDGGWYVFCNDRLILAQNTGAETVWTGSKGDGVPHWHAQFHRFRGYVFFEAVKSSDLPWNTTKTGMDTDSPYYKKVRSKMIDMTRQVLSLLEKLKDEKGKDNPDENQTLNKAVENSISHSSPVVEVLNDSSSLSYAFKFPEQLFNPPKKSNTVKISYQVGKEKYEEVKQELGVSNSNQVGLETFNYYHSNEIF